MGRGVADDAGAERRGGADGFTAVLGQLRGLAENGARAAHIRQAHMTNELLE